MINSVKCSLKVKKSNSVNITYINITDPTIGYLYKAVVVEWSTCNPDILVLRQKYYDLINWQRVD